MDHELVRRLAARTGLALSPEEVEAHAGDLEAVLAWMEELAPLDVSEVEPFLRPDAAPAPLRPDRPEPGLDAGETGSDDDDGFFRVPRVLESGR